MQDYRTMTAERVRNLQLNKSNMNNYKLPELLSSHDTPRLHSGHKPYWSNRSVHWDCVTCSYRAVN